MTRKASERLLVLATRAARVNHINGVLNNRFGHIGSREDDDCSFGACPHHDCVLVRDAAAGETHRCSGCGLRWEGELSGAELCGDCWRLAQPVFHAAGETREDEATAADCYAFMRSAPQPFRVEVDHGGCEHCAAGKTWTVVGPDDVALSRSYEESDEAEYLCNELNDAYAFGFAAARRDPSVGLRDGE